MGLRNLMFRTLFESLLHAERMEEPASRKRREAEEAWKDRGDSGGLFRNALGGFVDDLVESRVDVVRKLDFSDRCLAHGRVA